MKHKLPPLNWLRAFEASARHNSFAAAAQELHLTSAAISYQVRSLEEYLGFKLFDRLPRGIRLTDIGGAYLPSLRKAFDDISMSTMGLFGGDEKRTLTVRLPISYGSFCILPRLKEFRDQHPHIDLRVFSSVWADRVSEEAVDLEVRYGDGKWQGWSADRLDHTHSVVVSATPRPEGQSEREYLLEQAEQGVVQVMGCEDLWTRMLRLYDLSGVDVKVGTIADNSYVALEMAMNGMGTTLVAESFARRYLESGVLVRAVEQELDVEQAHYVLIPEGTEMAKPEALLFREWLLANFRV
ncbi:LysR substrate-binding domain-containing protein [Kiloniella sp. b19]|uniref:LysR substrate-binding domain-containing protein n=1 Tax=Kiloniella sp. GXU_MW_B19 TaxID=3141326 RepID=UPI0031E16A51